MKIFTLSPYVKEQFKQSPELHSLLTGDLDLSKDWYNFKKQNSHLDVFSLPRKYRQSRLALIAARDMDSNKPQDHLQTLKQTSQLAQMMIEFAYETAQQELIQKCGDVINTQGEKQQLIIFALGKLGGNELNYSSDVDLVFCYTGAGQSNGNKSLDALTYYQRLGRRIIQLLDSTTQDGIVYRVDMRLRPFGSAAPLVCSLNNLLSYLESEGRDWERYAWLRASFVAGDEESAQQTLANIQPFIYRKYLDYTIFESLRQIKEQITRKQLNDLDNLKLGQGGIREIEFIVQTLQLTFAGRNIQLRGNDLWQQMHRLHQFGHLKETDLMHLETAWLFLRKVENLCQIIQDRDTHHLPQETNALSICMRFDSDKEFHKTLKSHKSNVHSIFEKLFLSNKDRATTTDKNSEIQQLKDEISNKSYPKANKHKIYAALDAFEPYLEKYNGHKPLIQRFYQIINAISKRLSYLSMLIESPIIMDTVVKLISHSAYFSNALSQTPVLLEILFDSIETQDFDVEKQWTLFSSKQKIDDSEHYLETLCQFKQNIQFKVISAYIDGINDSTTSSLILTNLAEKILSLVAIQAHTETIKNNTSELKVYDLIIIAYGSLAMKNMHLDSDFDIVFILNQDINDQNHKFISRWIKRIIHLLSIQSYSGTLYKLDTQLRPNGKSGAAIVTQSNFENYQRNEAWLWEHAALIKSRAVYATAQQKQWFKQLRSEVLCQKRNPQTVDKELSKMAQKLQQLGNKNHQQEFVLLGNILKQAHDNPKIIDNIVTNQQDNKLKLDKSIHQNHRRMGPAHHQF